MRYADRGSDRKRWRSIADGQATSTAFTDIGSAGTYDAGTCDYTVEYLGDPLNNPTVATGCGDSRTSSIVVAAVDATVNVIRSTGGSETSATLQ